MIEPLESRIAPAVTVLNATTAAFIDVDGDQVTIKFSKPIAQQVIYGSTFGAPSIPGAEQLLYLELFNVTPAAAEGVNITFTAVPKDRNADGIMDGDGRVNVGEIRAVGKNLGIVTIPGDFARIEAGSGSGGTSPTALAALTVHSMGEYGLSTGSVSLDSKLAGKVGKIVAAGNVRDVAITLADPSAVFHSLGALSIGGSLIGGDANGSGFFNLGALGSASIRGDIVGGDGSFSGRIIAAGKINSLTVGGSVLGGEGGNSGSVRAAQLGTVKIGRDVMGGVNGDNSGVIEATGALGSLTMGGSLIGGIRSEQSGRITAGGSAGAIGVAGSLVGGAEVFAIASGVIEVTGKLASLSIGGSLLGGVAEFGASIVADSIDRATIRGDLRGGRGEETASITVGGAIGTMSIGGSLLGGFDPVTFDSELDGFGSASIITGGAINRLTIGGDIQGGSGNSSGGVVATTGIGTILLGGSLIGGTNESAGVIFTPGKITSLEIDGDLLGGRFAKDTGQVVAQSGIAKAVIGGSVIGGYSGTGSGLIDGGAGRIDSLSIGGDLRGGSSGNLTTISDTGAIHARKLGVLVIGGTVSSGQSDSFGPLLRSGWINADEQITSLTVKGDIVGHSGLPVLITAGGDPAITLAKPDIAIGALTVGGHVEHTFILAGYNKNGIGVSADASVGAVRVGGDWIGSYLTAGVEPGVDLIFGTANDRLLLGGADFGGGPVRDNLSVSKIASIVIGGQIKSALNSGLPFDGNQTYAFVAQQVGSFKYSGIVVPLLAGARNDTFHDGTARPLGASRSSLNTDGFAMHVFEV